MEGDQRGAEKRKEKEEQKGEEMMEEETRRQKETLIFNKPLICLILQDNTRTFNTNKHMHNLQPSSQLLFIYWISKAKVVSSSQTENKC